MSHDYLAHVFYFFYSRNLIIYTVINTRRKTQQASIINQGYAFYMKDASEASSFAIAKLLDRLVWEIINLAWQEPISESKDKHRARFEPLSVQIVIISI